MSTPSGTTAPDAGPAAAAAATAAAAAASLFDVRVLNSSLKLN